MSSPTIEAKMPKKKWFASKTLWFNIITGIVAVTGAITPLSIISAPVMLGISVVGNAILRLLTTKPIESPITKEG